MKKNNIQNKTLKWLVHFSIIILMLMWGSQLLFLKVFYEKYQINNLYRVAYKLSKNEHTIEEIESIAYKNNLCIEYINNDNIYIFGLTANEVDELWKRGYNSAVYYKESERLHGAIDRIGCGLAGEDFSNIENYLLHNPGVSDPYMCFADFDSYYATYNRALDDYDHRNLWTKKAITNIAKAGYFASDRSIKEYAENIWHIEPCKI